MHVDELYLGPISLNFQLKSGALQSSSPTPYGLGPLARAMAVDLGTPATLSATAICAVQAIAGAQNALINGTLASAGAVTLPETYGRCLSMISSNAGDTTQTVTVTGTDYLGNAMTERRTLNGTSIVNLTKAFKTVTQVAISAAMTGNFSMGNRDVFGIPIYISDIVYVASVKWAATLAQDAGTFTVGDATNPATNATNDTRGTYLPSSAANGSRRLMIYLVMGNIHTGPLAVPYSISGGATGCFGVIPA